MPPPPQTAVRLHLVDGTYELFRAHYSKRPSRRGPDGRDVKATVGMVESLLALLHDASEQVTHVAVAFDNPIRSFRNDLFRGYKDGSGVDRELREQFGMAEDAAAALGLIVWSMDRYEADDAIATAAARWRGTVDQVRIMSADKDLAQCVRGDTVVTVDRMRDRVTDETELRQRRGIQPESVPDFLALVGDAADGIPGLPGFGEKTAATLLAHYGHVAAIPDSAWDVEVRGAARLAATLAARRDDVVLYVRLATLVDDVPLEEELDDLAWDGVPRDRFRSWCSGLGVEHLTGRPSRWSP